MGHVLVVRVGGTGLDWDDELIELLGEATSLQWKRDREREDRETGPAQGLAEIILTAAVTAAVDRVADAVLSALLNQARQAIEKWRGRRIGPPPVSVEAESGTDEDSGAVE
jgi:hypothetical protein